MMSSTVVDHGANNDGVEGGASASASSTIQKNSDIQGYGQRARERLDQEKQKRREIQVLDHLPEPPLPPPLVGVVQTPTNVKKTRQRKRRISSNGTSSKKRSTTAAMVPIWTPDVSQIVQPAHKQDQSAWVVVHGLPKKCTIDHVRRFFVGLIPQSIVMLLSNAARMETLLDATSKNDNHGNKTATATAPPTQTILSSIRVLVRFESAAVAVLAAERSGETLSLSDRRGRNLTGGTGGDDNDDHDDDDDNNVDDDGPLHIVFGIAVTHLDKPTAKALINVGVKAKMMMIAKTITTGAAAVASRSNNENTTLEEHLASVEALLPTLVRETLWTRVYQECLAKRIELDEKTQQLAHLLMDLEMDNGDDNSKDGITTLTQYQSIARRHNQLVRLLEDLLERVLSWECKKRQTAGKVVQHLPQETQEAALWLTKQACAFLDQQVEHLKNAAQQVAFKTI